MSNHLRHIQDSLNEAHLTLTDYVGERQTGWTLYESQLLDRIDSAILKVQTLRQLETAHD